MALQFTILLLCSTHLISSHLLHSPKVHEDPNDFHVTRTPRQSDQRLSASHFFPPKFNFKAARQQDPQRLRYNQQQQIDAISISKRNRKERVVFNSSALSDKRRTNSTTNKQIVVLPMFNVKILKPPSSNSTLQNLLHNEEVTDATAAAYTRSNRQLKPSSYEVEEINDLEAQGSERYQDRDVLSNPRSTYVDPKVFNEKIEALSRSDSEGELRALNDLIGKNPDVQLRGLKDLLEDPEMIKGQPFSYSKNAIPVSESPRETKDDEYTRTIVIHEAPPASDEANQQGYASSSLEQLQAQLDASANARVQEVLKKAQRDAQLHIQEQHKALAAAQEQARQAAMEKIRKHNAAFSQEYLQEQPSHLPDQSSAQVAQNRIHAYPHASGYYSLAQAAASQESVEPVESYRHHQAPSHPEEEYVYATPEAPKPTVEQALAYVQIKPETIVQPTPIYPHITLQRPDGLLKIAEETKKYGSEHDELQYASKYAFGYRIRDYHSGNDYGHEEKREGKRAKGHYHVLLPDGRMQNVDYWADPSGFHAKVTYNNVAHH